MTTEAVGRLYSLVDPRDGAVRYVGQTTKTLQSRLAGHLASPAPKVALWIDELLELGLTPQIVRLQEGIPAAELLAVERAEITRRIIAGELLLNESATAPGRRVVQQKRGEELLAAREVAWATAAQMARESLGGPLSPGDLPTIPFSGAAWDAISGIRGIEGESDVADPAGGLGKAVRHSIARRTASEDLWTGCRGAWGRLRGRDEEASKRLELLIRGVVDIPWEEPGEASRYMALTPWALLCLAPWAALAERGGLSLHPDSFGEWVTDDGEVQDALRDLSERNPKIFRLLAAGEDPNDEMRPSTHLAVAALAETSGAAAPEVVDELKAFLRAMARYQMLTPAMAKLLAALDPRALDDVFGPDLTGAADEELGFPSGTAALVLRSILGHPRMGQSAALERLLVRASQSLPSTPYPDYVTWSGRGVCVAQLLTVLQAKAGRLTPPAGMTSGELVTEARKMWVADDWWLRESNLPA